jgi:hypothetical protein
MGLLAGGARARIEEAPAMRDGGEWLYQPEDVAAAMLAADVVVVGDGYLAGALGCRRLAVLAPPLGDWCGRMPGTAARWYPAAKICRATATPQGIDWRPALGALALAAGSWNDAQARHLFKRCRLSGRCSQPERGSDATSRLRTARVWRSMTKVTPTAQSLRVLPACPASENFTASRLP